MRTLAAIALAAFCALPAGGALADACGSPRPVVTVDMPSATVKVEHVRDVAAYTAFGMSAGASSGEQGSRWVINGLTVSALSIGMSFEGLSGRGCFAPTKIHVTLGVGDPVKVYIADKYAPGTCPYNAILEHEMQHVEILRSGRIIYAERFRSRIADAAAMGPFSDIDSAKARISGMMDVVRDEMKRALTAAHATIDTAESYMANQSRCPGW
jgi:hypothetical protein